MNWEILKLETVLEDPLLNLDNVYSFFATKLTFIAQNANETSVLLCVFWSQMRKESCLSKYMVDMNFGYLFHLTGGVKIFLKAKLHHCVFGHI